MEQKKNQLKIFCDNVKYLRKANGISAREMCRILKISAHSLKSLESGEVPPKMSVSVVSRLADYFDRKPFQLFSPLEPEKMED